MKLLAQGDFGEHLSAGGNAGYPAYIIKGSEHSLMIDAGINLMGPAYLQSLQSILGDRHALRYLFATHSHYDHLGSVPYLRRQLPGIKIGAAGRVEELLGKPSVLRFMSALSEPHRGGMRHIVGDEDVSLEPVKLDFHLREGDRFDLGGVSCEVHEVPGHTRDSLGFFIPEIRALFAGEAYGVPEGAHGEQVQVEFLSSYDDYLSSLQKMIALQPRIIGMAHMWVYTDDDATEFLRDSLQSTPLYRQLIESYLDQAHGDTEAACEAMARTQYDEKGTILQPRDAYIENLRAQVRTVAALRGKAPV